MPSRHALPSRRPTPTGLVVATLLLAAVGGCDWLIPLALLSHKEKIPAEFDKVAGKTTAIVVWAPQETLFDYPHVRMELSLHIADQLESHLKPAKLVDGRKIEDFLERTLSTAIDPEQIGREFDCQYVVYLELLDFQIRDPDAPDYLKAKIGASVTVYDMKTDPDEPRQTQLADVEAVYPENAPLLFNETNAAVVRKAAYEKFAEMVARKFYPYEVEM